MFFFCFSFLYHLIDITSFLLLLSLTIFYSHFCFLFFIYNSLIWISPNMFYTNIHRFFLIFLPKKRNETTIFLPRSLTSQSFSHTRTNISLKLSQLNYLVLFKLAHLAILCFSCCSLHSHLTSSHY